MTLFAGKLCISTSVGQKHSGLVQNEYSVQLHIEVLYLQESILISDRSPTCDSYGRKAILISTMDLVNFEILAWHISLKRLSPQAVAIKIHRRKIRNKYKERQIKVLPSWPHLLLNHAEQALFSPFFTSQSRGGRVFCTVVEVVWLTDYFNYFRPHR